MELISNQDKGRINYHLSDIIRGIRIHNEIDFQHLIFSLEATLNPNPVSLPSYIPSQIRSGIESILSFLDPDFCAVRPEQHPEFLQITADLIRMKINEFVRMSPQEKTQYMHMQEIDRNVALESQARLSHAQPPVGPARTISFQDMLRAAEEGAPYGMPPEGFMYEDTPPRFTRRITRRGRMIEEYPQRLEAIFEDGRVKPLVDSGILSIRFVRSLQYNGSYEGLFDVINFINQPNIKPLFDEKILTRKHIEDLSAYLEVGSRFPNPSQKFTVLYKIAEVIRSPQIKAALRDKLITVYGVYLIMQRPVTGSVERDVMNHVRANAAQLRMF